MNRRQWAWLAKCRIREYVTYITVRTFVQLWKRLMRNISKRRIKTKQNTKQTTHNIQCKQIYLLTFALSLQLSRIVTSVHLSKSSRLKAYNENF